MGKFSEYDLLSTQPGRWFVQRFQIYGLIAVGAALGFVLGIIASFELAQLAVAICRT